MSSLIGQSVGRYKILEQLGEGGMATVYKAFDTRLERYVAVKVIRPEKDQTGMFLKRFEREAKALAKLSHPNIVKVLDYGEQEGSPYLVMEFIPGGTLKDKLGKPINWREANRMLVPVAQALGYAHGMNIIHRDVKPSNILLTQSGEPMLSDFGIAKLLEGGESMELTGTSITIGTPEYMAPEQGLGQAVDRRVDIYALGVVLYEMVTGRTPYKANTPMAVLMKKTTEPLPPARNYVPDLPEGVDSLLKKALASKPEDRYQDMNAFVRGLDGLETGSDRKAPREEKTTLPYVNNMGSAAQARGSDSTIDEPPGPPAPIPSTVYPPPLVLQESKSNWKWLVPVGIGLLIVVVLCVGGGIIWALSRVNPTQVTQEPPVSFSTQELPTSQPVESQPIFQPSPTSQSYIPPTDTRRPQATSTPSCPGAKYQTRILADREARVCTKTDRVIVRYSPSMSASEILSLYTGTYIRVLEGPVCADDFWWWKVQVYPGTQYGLQNRSGTWMTDSSVEGWVREGWDNKDAYFICQP